MEGLFLGLDVGTQGTKGVLLDVEAGRVVARAAHGYDLIPGLAEGAAEQHPETWWQAIVRVTRALASAGGPGLGRVRAIGVSGQQHGFVPLDAEDRVIRPAKLWCDTETEPQARALSEAWGRPLPVGFTASKILWLKEREPDSFARLAAFLLPHDWVNLRLTGRRVMEAGDASGTGLFDPVARAFRVEDAAAIDPRVARMLPPLVAPDEPAGHLTEEAAAALGLPAGIPVAPGGGDNMMSAIGSGATVPGVVVCSLGTSGTVFAYSDVPVVDPEGLIAPFCDSTGGWLPLLCVMNGTGVLEEVRRAFASDHGALTRAASEVPAGSGGVLFLPYLQGERVPDLPGAAGSLLGLRAGSLTPGVLYRAALEGTALNLAWGVDRLRALGVPVDAVRVVGGGSKNELWCRILASAFDAPVQRLGEPESAALGGALQAAWIASRAAGQAADPTALGARAIALAGEALAPERVAVARYRDAGMRFREAVAGVYGAPPAGA